MTATSATLAASDNASSRDFFMQGKGNEERVSRGAGKTKRGKLRRAGDPHYALRETQCNGFPGRAAMP
jgi:hypothetical protein